MNSSLKRFFPHIIVLGLFVVVSLAYFSPVLQGKQILQTDIVQYTGMAKQHNDYRAETGEESYWTNSAFGGMPTYQLGAQYEHDYVKKLDRSIRFLPRPADYLFLYFVGFYMLMICLRFNYRMAFFGALAFGFSTYLIVIIGAGHNAKAHAIAYMPMVLAGVLLTFQKKYIPGFFLTCLALALEISANHFQMTYYLLLLLLVVALVYFIDAFRQKAISQFMKSVGILVIAAILSLGLNASNFLATQEYAKESTRGKSDLTINPDGTLKDHTRALDKEYITEYSYGIAETFNLFIPRMMGGANYENIGTRSATYDFLLKQGANFTQVKEFVSSIPTYWGDQPFVAAPAYIGAVILFLAFLGMFLLKGKNKWWLIAASILSIVLSWGKNFSFLTDFFINYVPLYDKFRAVSSIQVIVELCVPILGVYGLHSMLSDKTDLKDKKKALRFSTAVLGGICLLFLVFKNQLFSFTSNSDATLIDYYGQQIVDLFKEDRKAIFVSDTLRSLFLVLVAGGLLLANLFKKLKTHYVLPLLVMLVLFDLVNVNKRYVNDNNFVSKQQVQAPFQKTEADIELLKDDSCFRVYDLTTNPFSSGRASYFYNAVGGYHAAKPKRVQDLFDFYLAEGKNDVLNMLNVKYFMFPAQNGGLDIALNDLANGNAWFVNEIQWVENADEEIQKLDSLDTKNIALIHQEFKEQIPEKSFIKDSTATIKLVEVKPNYLYYESENKNKGLAVFSEIYYPHGWNAYINGKVVSHIRVNYTLRGLSVPEGFNKIEFKFEPQVVKTGASISLVSSIIFVLLGLGVGYKRYYDKNKIQ